MRVPRVLSRAIPRASAHALSRAGISRSCACPVAWYPSCRCTCLVACQGLEPRRELGSRALSRAGVSRRCACRVTWYLSRKCACPVARPTFACYVSRRYTCKCTCAVAWYFSRKCACPVAWAKLAACRAAGSRGWTRALSRSGARALSRARSRALSRAGSRGRSHAIPHSGSRPRSCRCRARPPGGAQLPPPTQSCPAGRGCEGCRHSSGHLQCNVLLVILDEV
ncbi:uncharacterized protein LOC141729376 [Zonotrichia albicollis]|uniref:uncharacterized protein LOC141729376 n=1 Tax=Zonotrichia albicollis TaxID=44394 RepID=UPI003D80C8B5